MELNSPISPIPSIETASKGKQTPSTSTRKKPETTICLEDEVIERESFFAQCVILQTFLGIHVFTQQRLRF